MTDAAKIARGRVSAHEAFEAAMAKFPKTMGHLANSDKPSAQNSKGTAMTDVAKIALVRWDEIIREEAESLADRDNSCDACCGAYGTATWKEYEQQVRSHFEEIGAAYLAVRVELERSSHE